MTQHILCPVDFSPCSDHAAAYAMDLAARLGARVTFLHSWEVPVYGVPDGALAFGAEILAQVQEASQKQLDAFIARFAGGKVAVAGRVTQGFPALEVVRRCDELGCDLVVMGTHGRSGLSRMLVGSVTERVLRTSKVPVVAVPMRG